MPEKLQSPILKKIDHFARRENTPVAQFLKAISPEAGENYQESKLRRLFEILLAVPASMLAVPLIAYLGSEIKKTDGGEVFFKHKRNDGTGEFLLWKLRCMIEGAEKLSDVVAPETILPEQDPRNTELGVHMRKYEVEELPQLIQVLTGRLRLVGLRATSTRSVNVMARQRPQTFESWDSIYRQEKGSLFSLNSAINNVLLRKNPVTRYHPDMLYAKKMSLGLDAYVITRNLINLLDKYLASKNG